jgi:hydrogenase maturation protease
MSGGILVAGIGNVFFGDDGFGVAVAARLAQRRPPPGARVADFGIRGMHLAYELLDGYDCLILIDAVPMGEPPGTLAVIDATTQSTHATGEEGTAPIADAHSMSPDVVLAALAHLGGSVDQVYIVGCQPASLDEGMELSPAVADAVEPAADLCRQLVESLVSPVASEQR